MAKPTDDEARLISALEARAGTINRLLDILRIGLENARDCRLRHTIQREIDYQIRELAGVHAERDQLRRRLHHKEDVSL